jgi:hypothetical protein
MSDVDVELSVSRFFSLCPNYSRSRRARSWCITLESRYIMGALCSKTTTVLRRHPADDVVSEDLMDNVLLSPTRPVSSSSPEEIVAETPDPPFFSAANTPMTTLGSPQPFHTVESQHRGMASTASTPGIVSVVGTMAGAVAGDTKATPPSVVVKKGGVKETDISPDIERKENSLLNSLDAEMEHEALQI